MKWVAFACLLVTGCALHAELAEDSPVQTAAPSCARPPDAQVQRFRHAGSRMFGNLAPRHRGYDLIALATDERQTIAGKLAYGSIDKDLGDEEVWLFACVGGGWQTLGTARTDGNGRFALDLAGAQRLPAGMRDVYAFVAGDGSGVRFLAYVAQPGDSVIVTDIDGTITAAENAVMNTVVFGDDIGHRTGAPQWLAQAGRVVVYVSSRGEQLTELTRRWLRAHGFPLGPLRLARAAVTLPGPRTVEYKTQVLRSLGLPIFAAIGNKHSDIESYSNAGVSPDRIYIKLPEFAGEVRDDLAARRAVGFARYTDLAPLGPHNLQ